MSNHLFLTGCDESKEWQLPWFISNFRKHSEDKLILADFGLSKEMRELCEQDDTSVAPDYLMSVESRGWFSKVEAISKTSARFGDSKVCWIDTDCEVKKDPSTIFQFVEENKLTVIVDHPWTKNGSPWTDQGVSGPWYNTGVVAYQGRPSIISLWLKEIAIEGKHRGDQEALYSLLNQGDLNRVIYISEAPHRYNVLRLDQLQDRMPKSPVIMHWTGEKGDNEIRRQMK